MQYVVVKPFAGNEIGAVIEPNDQLNDELLTVLEQAGYVHAAGGEEAKEETQETPAADDSVEENKEVKELSEVVRKELKAEAKAVAKETMKRAVAKAQAPKYSIPATPYECPVRNIGHAINLGMKALMGDNVARNKVKSVFGNAFNGRTITLQKSPTGNATTSTALGAALVPQRWSDELHQKALGYGSLINECEVIDCPDGSDTYQHPVVNDVSRADGSRPARHYIVGQSNPYTVSTIPFEKQTLTLQKVGILNAATDELLQDNNYGYQEKLGDVFANEMAFAFNKYLMVGTGSGQPGTGVMNSTCTYSVAATGAASQAIHSKDVNNLRAAMPQINRKTAKFVGSSDTTAFLEGMAFDPAATSKVSAFGLTYSLADGFAMKLKGSDYIESEFASVMGIAGDLLYVDFKQWAVLQKDIVIDMNPWANWLNGEVLCRATWRFDIKPLWLNKVAKYNGSNYWSPSVIIATRAST